MRRKAAILSHRRGAGNPDRDTEALLRLPGPGPAAERRPLSWTRAERRALLAFVVLAVATLPLTVHPWYDPTQDGSIYIATARSLQEGLGLTVFGEPVRIRPPGFPWMISPFVHQAGVEFRAIHLLVSASGVAALIALFALQRARTGWVLALLAQVVVWSTPGFRTLSNQVMSDVPGLALVALGLLLERRASRRPSLVGDALLGALLGAFAYVRTAVIVLVPAILASRLCERPLPRGGARWAVLPAAALLVQLPWILYARADPSIAAVEQTGAYSYATAMWNRVPGDPASSRLGLEEILQHRVPDHLTGLVASLGSGLTDLHPTPASAAWGSVLLAGSLWVLFKRRAPADFLLAGTVAVVAVYFGFQARLALPVYALAVPAALEAARDLASRLRVRAASWAAPAAAVIWAAAIFAPRPGWDRIRAAHEAWRERAEAVAVRLDPDARLGAPRGWDWSVYLGRPVASLRFRVKRSDDPAAALEDSIESLGLNTVVVDPREPSEGIIWRVLEERYGPAPGDRIRAAAGIALVRVRP